MSDHIYEWEVFFKTQPCIVHQSFIDKHLDALKQNTKSGKYCLTSMLMWDT